jgi:hypothetical protein
MRLRAFLDRLGERTRPHYGQLVLWTLLACAAAFTVYFETHWSDPEKRTSDVRTGPVSVISFLPDAALLNRGVHVACGVLFAAGAALWVFRVGVPWSAWLTAVSFSGVLALYFESVGQVTHVAHPVNAFLYIYALWYTFYAADIRAANRAGRFWATPLYPRWAYSLGVFYLGLFYGLSGLNKLATSGFGWANGVSLQLWAELFGDKGSWFTQAILSSRAVAAALQWAALAGECGGLVAVVSARLRPFVGLLLIGFHVGQIAVFGWGFHANMALLALTFLPAYQWTPRAVARLEGRFGRGRGTAAGAADRITPPDAPRAARGVPTP